jgi:hypothetical protein
MKKKLGRTANLCLSLRYRYESLFSRAQANSANLTMPCFYRILTKKRAWLTPFSVPLEFARIPDAYSSPSSGASMTVNLLLVQKFPLWELTPPDSALVMTSDLRCSAPSHYLISL